MAWPVSGQSIDLEYRDTFHVPASHDECDIKLVILGRQPIVATSLGTLSPDEELLKCDEISTKEMVGIERLISRPSKLLVRSISFLIRFAVRDFFSLPFD